MSHSRALKVEFTFGDPNGLRRKSTSRASILKVFKNAPSIDGKRFFADIDAISDARDHRTLREQATRELESKPEIFTTPETSPTRYISGIVVLNIPCEAWTGDWHEANVFFTPRVRIPRSFIIERGHA